MKKYWDAGLKEADANAAADVQAPAGAAAANQAGPQATSGWDSEDDYDRARLQRLRKGKADADGWKAELQRYEADLAPEVDKKTDLVRLWSESTGVYPTLSRMALDILPIPAASTGAESLFSRAKEVTTDRRSRLDPEILEQVECLSWHWKGTLADYARINEDTVEVVEGLEEFKFLESQETLFFDDEAGNAIIVE